MKALKQWNDSRNLLVALAPVWVDQFMAADVAIYTSGVFSTKEIELISIALDASYTHMYAFGTQRHIKAALKAGAAVEEIKEVLKLCVVPSSPAISASPFLLKSLRTFRAPANQRAGRS
jgi:alkylhydroperoxidase/carboxymuconolactone decarboxylase family protein YurZ